MSRQLRTCIILAVVTIAVALGPSSSARADADWCSSDPPVHLTLPSGQPLEANVWVSVPKDDQSQLQAASVTGTVTDVQGGLASVVVSVLVPTGGAAVFPVQASSQSHGSSNGSGTIQGNAGTPVAISFQVALPPGLQ